MIGVVVLEDDFRVARVHAEFTDRAPGFRVLRTARNAARARELIGAQNPDLALLDNYLPGHDGVALLTELEVDAIVLTAADPATVRTAFAAGALNYLVKPFTAEQLADRLNAYARYRARLPENGGSTDQEEIDRAVRLVHEGDRPTSPKGQSPLTSQLVFEALRSSAQVRSVAEITEEPGVSRATAQRLLAALTQDGRAIMALRYGSS